MAESASNGVWQVGEWRVDPSDDTISRNGETIKLEPRTMRLLICLAESAGSVVGIDRLLSEVWSGLVVGPASVYQSVSYLRKLLRDTDSPPTYIATVARKGYRLVATVSHVTNRPGQSADPHEQLAGPRQDRASPLEVAAAESAATGEIGTTKARGWRRWQVSVPAAVAVLIAATLAWFFLSDMNRPSPTPALAVLPFDDMSAAQNDQPFCDGLTEELSSWLAQLPTLRVVARTSAFAYRDKAIDVREIGRVLGVTHVLKGSVRRSGDRIRITVHLIDTKDRYDLWAGSYEPAGADLLRVQEQIARAIASSLEIRLTQATTQSLTARRSTSGEAYQLYLLARHYRQQQSRDDNEHAIELYKQSIAADGEFALAYVGLADEYLNQRYYASRPIGEIASDMEPLLARAEKLNARLSETYVVRGALLTELKDNVAAQRSLQHAIELSPNSSRAYSELGFLYLTSGRPRDAAQNYARAAELDPVQPYLHTQRCLALQDLARFEEAELACSRARALAPDSPTAYEVTAALAESRGAYDEALRWSAQALQHGTNIKQFYVRRADWLLTLGLTTAARKTYDQAVNNAGSELLPLDLALMTAYGVGGEARLKAEVAKAESSQTLSPSDLLYLANAELMLGDWQHARQLADKALASGQMQADMLFSPWSARTGFSFGLILAMAQQQSGDAAGARQALDGVLRMIDQSTAAGMERFGMIYLQAAALAMRGDAAAAMTSLNHARELGWRGAWWAEHEPFFATLRGRADYQALIRRINAANEKLVRQLPSEVQP